MDIDGQTTMILLILGISLLAGVVASKLSYRIGLPALVLFVAVGMTLGSWIYFDDAWLSQLVGTVALVQILFDGGLQTEWRLVRPIARPAVILATLGVVATTVITGLITWWVLGVDLPTAMLVGAIVGSTDAAATFAVIGTSDLPARLKHTLEFESGMNDPMAVFLTILVLDWIKLGPPNLLNAFGFLFWQMGLGVVAGLLVGRFVAWALPKLRLQASGLYPILMTALAFTTYGLVSWLNGSGFMAVYILGIVIARGEIPYRQSVYRFHEGLAWIAQIVMFTLLGLLVFPAQAMKVAIPGMLIAAGLMLVARPIAVWLLTIGQGFSVKERWLLSWAGLRGAVPIIVATYPLLAGIPGSHLVFNVVFFVVLSSAALQGSTISWVADKLGLLTEGAPPRPITLELVAMERLNADMIEVELSASSSAVGHRLAELHLPDQVTVSAIYRKGKVVTPRGGTRLLEGDVLFILVNKEQSPIVQRFFVGDEA